MLSTISSTLKEFFEKSDYSVNFIILEFFDNEHINKIIDLLKPESKTGYKDIYIITNLMETDMHRVIYSK